MDAGLVLELRVNAIAFDQKDGFLESTDARFGGIQDLTPPALSLGVPGIHSHHFGCKQRSFIAAGSRSNFENYVFLVVRILGQKQKYQVGFDRRASLLKFAKFG